MIQQYQDEVLSAVPFCCVACGRAADALFHMPTAHLQGADPVIFDIPTPYCGSSACEDFAMAKAKAAAGNLGHGSRRRFAESCTGARGAPKYKDLNHLAHVELTACVICGDSVNVQRCGRCKIVPYCSTYCQKVGLGFGSGVCELSIDDMPLHIRHIPLVMLLCSSHGA